MRVCHVITRLIVGGAQENTIATVLGLRERAGFEVSLLSGPTTGPEGSLESSLRQAPGMLNILPELVRPVHPPKDWTALRKLTLHFRQLAPDIVHTHSGKAGILGRLAAHRAGVPVILHTIHGPSFGDFQGALSNLIFRAAERRAARCTRHFLSVADAMSAQYLAAGIGRPADYTRVFSGFPLEPFLGATNDPQLRARLGLKPGDFVIGKIARLFQHKGHDALFAAAPAIVKELPSARFLLVGGGEWRERFERLARESGLERHFIFTGLVPPEQVPALVGVMDALVHLSEREGLARALPQALAAGKPVAAFDRDGAREVCIPGETGFLIPPGNLDALVEKLVALGRNADLRHRLGEQGRAFVQSRFSVRTMVDSIAALYHRFAPEREGSSRHFRR